MRLAVSLNRENKKMLNFRTENLFARFLKESFLIEKYGV